MAERSGTQLKYPTNMEIDMKDFEDLESKVIGWSLARGIIPNSTSTAQLLKAVSEMGELADAEAKQDRDAKIDAVGDVLVCLINYCALSSLDIVACLDAAYEQIKDRRGTMLPGGVFVKEEA